MRGTLLTLALLATLKDVHSRPNDGWDLERIKSIVTFGDSYTDESRIGYFAQYGTAPPVGWVEPESNSTASGGRTWARFAAQSLQANLYNYAVSGAVCSNNITPRTWDALHAPFPSVLEYEVPAFVADSKYRLNDSKLFLDIPPSQTAYAIWIGTNDLGNAAFLTDSQVSGKTLPDYVNCIYDALDQVYKNGGRYFVLMNLAPLNLLPQYSVPERGGQSATRFWPTKSGNMTEISYRMAENVATVNDIFKYRTPFEFEVAERYNDAHFAIFDTNGLLTDVYNNPAPYFGSISPVNVTGFVSHCDLGGGNCFQEEHPERFLWYDELHPSEQADRIIANSFVDVLRGESKWATYWE